MIRFVTLKRFKSNSRLADLASVEKRRDKAQRGARAGDKVAKAELEVLDKILPVLEEGRPARAVELDKEEKADRQKFLSFNDETDDLCGEC